MKNTIKFCVMVLMTGILIFSPLVAFAQEAGEASDKKVLAESLSSTAEPSSEEGEVGLENPDPTSSPLAEAYERCVSPPHPPHGPKGPNNP